MRTCTMSACPAACQSIYLSVSVLQYEGQCEQTKTARRGEVLSVSAGWAGSWWEQEGGRLAGRSHALFRHHSVGARPLGQNTTRFSETHPFTHDYCTHLPKLGSMFCNSSCLCRSRVNSVVSHIVWSTLRHIFFSYITPKTPFLKTLQ